MRQIRASRVPDDGARPDPRPLWAVRSTAYYLLMLGPEGTDCSPRYRWTPLWCVLLLLPLWAAVAF